MLLTSRNPDRSGRLRWLVDTASRISGRYFASGRIRNALAEAEDKAWAAERKAKQAHDRLRDALDALPEGIVFLDPEGRYVLWNERYAEIYKGSSDLFKPGARLADTLRTGVRRGDYPAAIGREEEWLAERLEKLANPGDRHEQQLADGRWIMIEERRTREGGTIGVRVDVTEMKRREESFRTLFEDNPVPMVVHDRGDLSILAVNQSGLALYGYAREVMLGMRLPDLWLRDESAPDPASAAPAPDSTGHDWRHCRADGTPIDVTVFSRPLLYDGHAAAIVSIVDISERKQAEARVAHMARHDPLTDLPNRMSFRERVESRLTRSHDGGFAVLFLGLDHFKTVNETLGRPIGDRLLQAVAERLRLLIGDASGIARLGGDEFAILCAHTTAPQQIHAFAQRVIDALSRPHHLDGHPVEIGASIGAAIAPADSADPDQLLKCADLALDRAKEDGRGTCRFFEPEMDARIQLRRALELDLRRAIVGGELEVHYQPLVDISSGKIAGFEALARWTHRDQGAISPTIFIPIAEEMGLIGELGEFVLNKACRDAKNWPDEIKVAVNMSPSQFKSCNVLALVLCAIEQAGILPSRLEIEITESLLVETDEATLAALQGLRALGIGISMDDFGTGYSSLSYLRSFPFTKIKIDKSFIHELSDCPERQAIVRAIIGLGTSLGMKVTAEGVEQARDLAYLRAHGCTEAQGFLFSQARPAEETGRLISLHAAA